jgi:4-diphosphocytidyl-2-C-methyl-D-erythritol kinase
LHDTIFVSQTKNKKDKIHFSGKFKKGINNQSNTITKVIDLFRKEKFFKKKTFKIIVKKNIPHGSGLGGGSSNAANLINFFNSKMKLKIKKEKLEKLALKIGSDVPICLEKKNTFLTGKKYEIVRVNKKLKLNILIVYPNLLCSTKKIYGKNKKFSLIKSKLNFKETKPKQILNFLLSENNDLEKAAIKIYPKIKKIINYIRFQNGCYFSRITGSGSACIGVFSNIKNAKYAKKMINLKYPKYWCAISKTI